MHFDRQFNKPLELELYFKANHFYLLLEQV